jgi:ribosomal protein S12 methylthiotransferase accessory factor
MRHSSARYRSRRPETTLRYAREWAGKAAISEVTDITPLDRLGLPVFVSVRPTSRADIFTYGKGPAPIDAEVGAYMEAIEYFFAEPGNGSVETRWATARSVAGAEQSDDAILDFAPLLHHGVDLDAPLLLASAANVENQDEVWVPAELVYHPLPEVGQSVFGSSTNGLASGNSVLEASFHALAELIERDIWSFECARGDSALVDSNSLPEDVQKIVERAEGIGLRLLIRSFPNDYGLAFFAAFLFDPADFRRKSFNGGWGCHLDRGVALVRAVTEAAQSRLAFIHGGRKAPALPAGAASRVPIEDEQELVRRQVESLSDARNLCSFNDLPDFLMDGALEDQFLALIKRLRRVTDRPIYRTIYTPADEPLQVVRLMVPLLESFTEARPRVGRRLRSALQRPTPCF